MTASGFFELRFDAATGGGIDRFFDLAEDPTRAYDLAGGAAAYGSALFGDGIDPDGSGLRTTSADTAGRFDLLEATPTRVKVRQRSRYVQAGTSLQGVRGFGDYTIQSPGRVAFRWSRKPTSNLVISYNQQELGFFAHYQTAAPLNAWSAYGSLGALPQPSSTFVLLKSDVGGARTDFLAVMHAGWSLTTGVTNPLDSPGEIQEARWFRGTPGSLPPPSSLPFSQEPGEVWSFLTYFKPTSLVDQSDPAVTSRSSDYRNPALLNVNAPKGSQWVDVAENTALATDWFNESEAAYPLELDPLQGLDFDFDVGGSPAQPRYSPLFKIRQWHSLAPPRQIAFGGRVLTRHVEYDSDLKPISRAHWAPKLLWHCSVQGSAGAGDCTAPDVGTPGGGAGQTSVAFVPGRYGNAAKFTAAPGQYIATNTADFNAAAGAVEFWYQPAYDSSTDATDRVLWSRQVYDGTNYYCFLFWKTSVKTLFFKIATGPTCGGVSWSTSSGASWRGYDWVHLKTTWSATGGARIYLDGKLLASSPLIGFAPGPALVGGYNTYFGGCPSTPGCTFGIAGFANGLIDEPRIYGPLFPPGDEATHPLANGGLLSDINVEYLASAARNSPLAFSSVDPSRRGPYLYFGADSKFRGLNVWLATPGAGSSPALAWEYWSSGSGEWQPLPGIQDDTGGLTINLKSSGPVYWPDLSDWGLFSVDGSPDLYYVRVHLASGDYLSSYPVESLIKTDILLLQYQGDVSASGQSFAVPVPAWPWSNPTDLQVTKTSGSATAEQWETVRYTLTVTNNGPATASNVQLVDALPPELEFVSYSYSGGGACGYAAAARIFSCSFPAIGTAVFETVTLDAMVLAATGDVTNRASVTADEPDPDSSNDTAEWTLSLAVTAGGVVPFLTVTSKGVENVVEFLNPVGSSCDLDTVVVRKSGGYPADETDGTPLACSPVGFSGQKCSCPDSSGLSPGTTYYYGAFVNLGLGMYGFGRYGTGRPPDASQTAIKWAFSTGTFGVAAPTVTAYGVVATANDRVVYSMQRGASGGLWATGAPSGDWRPFQMGGIVQWRSPFVPAGAVTEDTVYLGAQDGRVYALNAQTGALKAGWTFTQVGATLQAPPAGIFINLGGGYDDLLVGTRDLDADNVFCALRPGDGSWADGTMAGSCYGGIDPPTSPGRIGIVNGMASVDYGSPPFVYFASRRRDARVGNDQTLWRLRLGSAPVLQYASSLALDEIDSSPILANDFNGAKRVYVGSSTGTGTLYSLPPDLSTVDRTPLSTGDGQVKGFVFPDRSNPGHVYFATDTLVSGAYDDGTSLSPSFNTALIPGVRPSSPVLLANGYLYVGGTDGRLYKIDPTLGTLVASVRLGDGKAVVGAPSYDAEHNLIHVGTEAGVYYAVDPSLLVTDPTCLLAAACTSGNLGQACYNSNPAVECTAKTCQGVGSCF